MSAGGEALGLERFAVLGISGGSRYAAVCAWTLPQRLTSAGIVSGISPLDVPGATHGMSRQNRLLLQRVGHLPVLPRLLMGWRRHGRGGQIVPWSRDDAPLPRSTSRTWTDPSSVRPSRRRWPRRSAAAAGPGLGAAAVRPPVALPPPRHPNAGVPVAWRAGRQPSHRYGPTPGGSHPRLPGQLLSRRGPPALRRPLPEILAALCP
jgi:pimeloyl-ACP methyl ester carboxylesterase